jgi:hypothetical protein
MRWSGCGSPESRRCLGRRVGVLGGIPALHEVSRIRRRSLHRAVFRMAGKRPIMQTVGQRTHERNSSLLARGLERNAAIYETIRAMPLTHSLRRAR